MTGVQTLTRDCEMLGYELHKPYIRIRDQIYRLYGNTKTDHDLHFDLNALWYRVIC
jgi:hypothetical protein